MTSFQQTCPNCRATLELPGEADGKLAVCPACQHQFTAAAIASATPQPQWPRPATTVREVPIETVLADARLAFALRRRPLLLPFLIPSFLALVGLVYPLAYFNHLANQDFWLAIKWMALCSPWFVLLVSYVIWFALNLAADVCEFPDGVSGGIRFWMVPRIKSLVGLVAVNLAFAALLGALIALNKSAFGIVAKLSSIEIQFLVMGGVVALSLALLVGVSLWTWPLWPLAYRDGLSVSVVRRSLAAAQANSLTSFLLVVVLGILTGLGFASFLLGAPLLIPIGTLIVTVAAGRVTGQTVPVIDLPEGDREEKLAR